MLSIAIWLLDSSKLGQLAMSVRQATLWSWSNKVAQLCCLSKCVCSRSRDPLSTNGTVERFSRWYNKTYGLLISCNKCDYLPLIRINPREYDDLWGNFDQGNMMWTAGRCNISHCHALYSSPWSIMFEVTSKVGQSRAHKYPSPFLVFFVFIFPELTIQMWRHLTSNDEAADLLLNRATSFGHLITQATVGLELIRVLGSNSGTRIERTTGYSVIISVTGARIWQFTRQNQSDIRKLMIAT